MFGFLKKLKKTKMAADQFVFRSDGVRLVVPEADREGGYWARGVVVCINKIQIFNMKLTHSSDNTHTEFRLQTIYKMSEVFVESARPYHLHGERLPEILSEKLRFFAQEWWDEHGVEPNEHDDNFKQSINDLRQFLRGEGTLNYTLFDSVKLSDFVEFGLCFDPKSVKTVLISSGENAYFNQEPNLV